MATFVSNGPCPKCGSKDNLATYNDGSKWCWGCHYYAPPDHGKVIESLKKTLTEAPNRASSEFSLGGRGPGSVPSDLTSVIGGKAWEWINEYDVTTEELVRNNVRYSPSREQLIFQWFGEYRKLILWQSRNFSTYAKAKASTHGNPSEVMNIVYKGCRPAGSPGDVLVLVEDPVSALRVARQQDSMALLGSHISAEKLLRVRSLYKDVIFWLDHNKYRESQNLAMEAEILGLSTSVSTTVLDPKYLSDSEIRSQVS